MGRFLLMLFLLLGAVPVVFADEWPARCIQPIAVGQTVNGQLSDTDCIWYYSNFPYFTDVYALNGTAGQEITVLLRSGDFDAYLEIYDTNTNDPTATPLAFNNNGGGNFDAMLVFTPLSTGTYYIHASSRIEFEAGYYVLTLSGDAAVTDRVVEYYHAGLDHYFITWMPNEIAILDAGTQIRGWTRTGHSFKTYTTPQAGTSPVCRYYIPPELGDSHFFGRGTVECNATGQKNPTFVLEDPAFMQTFLPAAGACPASTTPVYRVYSNRVDANHRYMTDRTVRDQMVAKGWLAEGDGADLIVMCAPQ